MEEREGTVVAVLSFKRSQLLYDVECCAHIEGSVMDAKSEHNRHMVQDVGQECNVDRVTRMFDLAVAKCKEILHPYTKSEVKEMVSFDNRLRERDVYGVVLWLPAGFSHTTLKLLELAVHNYIVSYATADWMSITNPAKEEVWKLKAAEAEVEIRRCTGRRTTRLRRGTHPF